jgi:putative Mg2+ transporter-C (MgtC) family protein
MVGRLARTGVRGIDHNRRMSTDFWPQVVAALRDEFSDLSDVDQLTRTALRLVLALTFGAMIGWERERRDAAAGLRTHMLVALGAAVFVLAFDLSDADSADLSRVVQGVVAGIGFLGAGAVLKLEKREQIHGLTTAASIWVTAAVGVIVGLGREGSALMITLLVLVVLAVLLRVEKRAARKGCDGDGDGDGDGRV